MILEAPSYAIIFYSFWSSMECSEVYVTLKRKFNRNTNRSHSETLPVEKRAKESKSADVSKTMQFELESGGFKHHSKKLAK